MKQPDEDSDNDSGQPRSAWADFRDLVGVGILLVPILIVAWMLTGDVSYIATLAVLGVIVCLAWRLRKYTK